MSIYALIVVTKSVMNSKQTKCKQANANVTAAAAANEVPSPELQLPCFGLNC